VHIRASLATIRSAHRGLGQKATGHWETGGPFSFSDARALLLGPVKGTPDGAGHPNQGPRQRLPRGRNKRNKKGLTVKSP
jgi:hypothetical protein